MSTAPRLKRKRTAMPSTRHRILDAAKFLFSSRGFEQVGIREIAKRARVDHGLVIRHFKSKKNLFAEAIELEFTIEDFLAIDDPGFGRQMALSGVLDPLLENEVDMFGLLIGALGTPETAMIAGNKFHEEFVSALAGMIGGRRAELRATLIAAYVLGLAIMKRAFKAPALQAFMTNERVAALAGAAMDLLALKPEACEELIAAASFDFIDVRIREDRAPTTY